MKYTDESQINTLRNSGRITHAEAATARSEMRRETVEVGEHPRVKLPNSGKHHGMIFNAEMVRAILDGSKTQTRRPYKGCKPTFYPSAAGGCWGIPIGEREKWPIKVGDIIWVRETFALTQFKKPVYKADNRDADGIIWPSIACDPDGVKWTPSIHMPRWASRINLQVTAVRVERVQDISEEDAKAEGLDRITFLGDTFWKLTTPIRRPEGGERIGTLEAKAAFQNLWQSIYANWDANPFVWVYEFRRVK